MADCRGDRRVVRTGDDAKSAVPLVICGRLRIAERIADRNEPLVEIVVVGCLEGKTISVDNLSKNGIANAISVRCPEIRGRSRRLLSGAVLNAVSIAVVRDHVRSPLLDEL